MFDLDGTIWKWTELLPYAQKCVNDLTKKGKKVYFVTNVAVLSRKDLAGKLTKFGIPATEEQIISSGYTAAKYFDEKGIDKVYAIAERGVLEELNKCDVNTSEKANHVLYSVDRNFTFWKLKRAYDLIADGAALYTTGMNKYWSVGDEIYPAEAPFLKAIEEMTGQKAIVLGKPSDYMKKRVFEDILLFPEDVLFIGDSLKTDMVFANKCNFCSALVLTGSTTAEEAKNAKGQEKPRTILRTLRDIVL